MGNHLWPFESASGLSSSQASGECLSGRGGASPWIFPWIILVYLGVSFRLQIFDMNSFPWYVHIIIVIDICIGIYTISLSLYIYSPYIYSKELWFSHGPSAIFPPCRVWWGALAPLGRAGRSAHHDLCGLDKSGKVIGMGISWGWKMWTIDVGCIWKIWDDSG